MTTLHELYEQGQSPWLDYISKKILNDGTLAELIDKGVVGLTSNPSIFDNAISKTGDYDAEMLELSKKGCSIFEIYDELTVADIQKAADMFLPVYEKTNKKDGYVSLEINPKLARSLEETIAEGKRLYAKVNRPNLMLKVPATAECMPAIEEFISSGMNVNVTLIFSQKQYVDTAHAYINGIKKRKQSSSDTQSIHSVASVFISRIDTSADKQLGQNELKGCAACANAELIYEKFREIFADFKDGNPQRPLWASTGTKNPDYSDVKYIEELIRPQTVNTIPESTLRAFIEKGKVSGCECNLEKAKDNLEKLSCSGVDIDKICSQLLEEGLVAFESAFDSLMNSIENKISSLKNK